MGYTGCTIRYAINIKGFDTNAFEELRFPEIRNKNGDVQNYDGTPRIYRVDNQVQGPE